MLRRHGVAVSFSDIATADGFGAEGCGRQVEVTFEFGGSIPRVSAFVQATGQEVKAELDWIWKK